ncbi:hypothetical protein EZS27_014633 [termite gut metagenome]|uniref:Uncharacterized protein n=1 Tax=termite gut metagenome TaxID=433724 RepID=A0A5J4RWG6_9ZZZZ
MMSGQQRYAFDIPRMAKYNYKKGNYNFHF